MTQKMRTAFDRQPTALLARPKEFCKGRPVRPEPLTLSIVQALEWAFAVEFAHLDFNDLADDHHGGGWDTIAVLMERGALGCKVDGGGRSRPASDAEVIVEALGGLPVGCGGQGMAIQMAGHARTGSSPDWMQGAVPRMVPVDTRMTKHGLFARTEVIGHYTSRYRGRDISSEITWCPVSWAPSAATIASARRHYLQWWGALLHLRAELATGNRLERVTLSHAMPPMKPW